MLRKNYETIKTGRGLITTVNHNIPDSLNDVPLHKGQCRQLVVFGSKKKSLHRKSLHMNSEKMNVVEVVRKGHSRGKKGKVQSSASGNIFFFLNINVFREKYGKLGEVGTGYCEEGGGPGERT
jgi:hypothetical protein